MSQPDRWTAEGLPILSPAEKSGMKDFWEAYEANYDAIRDELMEEIKRLPDMAAVIQRMPKDQLDAQSAKARELMRAAVLNGDWGPLLQNQRTNGATYASMGVRFREWFELVSSFQASLTPFLIQKLASAPDRLTAALIGMSRYIDIAMSVIAEEYLTTKERLIAKQREAIAELSTPVLQVRDRMLLLPIIGVLDTQRARMLTEHLLIAISERRARVVVMDITGVPAVDSKVANHLLQTVAAARLMGARVLVTGLSPDVARALVTLGVDLSRLQTVGDLQGGLEEANRLLGHHPAEDGRRASPMRGKSESP